MGYYSGGEYVYDTLRKSGNLLRWLIMDRLRRAGVQCLRVGAVYLGRDEWHLKVLSVKVTERRVTVEGMNGFGEVVTEYYPLRAIVELIDDYN